MNKSHLFYVFWWFFSTWLIRSFEARAKSWLHRCGELFAITSFTFKGWATSELLCESSFQLRFFYFRTYFLKQNIIILRLLALLFIFWLVSVHEIWDVGMHLTIPAKFTATLLLYALHLRAKLVFECRRLKTHLTLNWVQVWVHLFMSLRKFLILKFRYVLLRICEWR